MISRAVLPFFWLVLPCFVNLGDLLYLSPHYDGPFWMFVYLIGFLILGKFKLYVVVVFLFLNRVSKGGVFLFLLRFDLFR